RLSGLSLAAVACRSATLMKIRLTSMIYDATFSDEFSLFEWFSYLRRKTTFVDACFLFAACCFFIKIP
ncbi:MAG: hypothetical protein ABF377_00535, partial [Akkermansiaceae bacterium]